MSDDGTEYPRLRQYAWVGPQLVSNNGLPLRSVVRGDQDGTFHAGTRYGPLRGSSSEEYFITKGFTSKEEAIFAAKTETSEILRGCNGVRKKRQAEMLMERATSPVNAPAKPSRGHVRLVIDR